MTIESDGGYLIANLTSGTFDGVYRVKPPATFLASLRRLEPGDTIVLVRLMDCPFDKPFADKVRWMNEQPARETFVWDAAQLAKRAGKPVVVLQVGDYDNSGLDMMRDAEKRLRAMAAPLPVRFVRVAVKPEHIAKYDLPTRPQKEDKRGLIAVEEAVEIDAMDPDVVQALLVRELRRYMADYPASRS